MDVLNESRSFATNERSIPFWEQMIKSERVLDAAMERGWLDDAENRLRQVVSSIDPRPIIVGYCVERSADGLTLCTVTGTEVAKRQIGLLSAGDWPHWEEIVEQVPEFDGTAVVFDAVQRLEWFRRWDMRLQHDRICAEYGIFS